MGSAGAVASARRVAKVEGEFEYGFDAIEGETFLRTILSRVDTSDAVKATHSESKFSDADHVFMGTVGEVVDALLEVGDARHVGILKLLRPFIDDSMPFVLWDTKTHVARLAPKTQVSNQRSVRRRDLTAERQIIADKYGVPGGPLEDLTPASVNITGRGYHVTGASEQVIVHEILHAASDYALSAAAFAARDSEFGKIFTEFEQIHTRVRAALREKLDDAKLKYEDAGSRGEDTEYLWMRYQRLVSASAYMTQQGALAGGAHPRKVAKYPRGERGRSWRLRRGIHETIAMMYTEPIVQEVMKEIKLPKKPGEKWRTKDGNTLWDKFVGVVAKIFKVKEEDRTLLAHAMAAHGKLMRQYVTELQTARGADAAVKPEDVPWLIPDTSDGLAVHTQRKNRGLVPPAAGTPKPVLSAVEDASAAGAKTTDEIAEARRLWEEEGVESPFFKEWFGDSKIVDEAGQPLVVYHGTAADFDEFDPAQSVAGRLTNEYGIYTTPREQYAKQYATWAAEGDSPGKTLPLYLSIRNPLIVEGKDVISPRDLTKVDIDKLKARGYDGIVVVSAGKPISQASEIVAFEPTQIKSKFNRGTFAPDEPRIQMSAVEDASAAGARGADEVAEARRLWEEEGFESRFFKAWFGASKVVDEAGQPLVMYHGTAAEFDAFDRPYIWASTDPKLANEYADFRDYAAGGGGSVMPIYVRVDRPFIADGLPKGVTPAQLVNEMINQSPLGFEEMKKRRKDIRALLDRIKAGAKQEKSGSSIRRRDYWLHADNFLGEDGAAAVREAFKLTGFDGVKLTERGTVTFAAFEPTQIKSQFNRGTFARDEPRIQMSAVEEPRPLTEEDLVDLSTRLGSNYVYEDIKVPRVQASRRLNTLLEKRDAGVITAAEFLARVTKLADEMAEVSDLKIDKRLFAERVRGADILREKLIRARRVGDIKEETADLALWLLDQNPALADGLAISIRAVKDPKAATAGNYLPLPRIMTLFKGRVAPETAVHEILHHTERMMPIPIQSGIRRAWASSITRAMKDATPEQATLLQKMLNRDRGAYKEIEAAFQSGVLERSKHYQFVNPSEFWAVNGSRILAGQYKVAGTWVAAAKQWLLEFVETMKSIVGAESDAAILKGLKEVLNGDGTFVSRLLLSGPPSVPLRSLAETPPGWGKVDAGMTPPPSIPVGVEGMSPQQFSLRLKELGTAEDAARFIAENASDESYREIAKRIIPFVGKIPLSVLDADLDASLKATGDRILHNARGAMHRKVKQADDQIEMLSQRIWIRGPEPSGLNTPTVLHELLHAATSTRIGVGMLRKNKNTELGQASRQLRILAYEVRKQLTNQSDIQKLLKGSFQEVFPRGFSESELLAWGLTNPQFQEFLKTVKLDPEFGASVFTTGSLTGRAARRSAIRRGETRDVTAYTAFVELIRRILGISPKEVDALSELIRVSDELLTVPTTGLPQAMPTGTLLSAVKAPPLPQTPEEIAATFTALGKLQNAKPESAMLAMSNTQISPLWSVIAEHVGDIIRRMTPYNSSERFMPAMFGVIPKTRRGLTDLAGDIEGGIRMQAAEHAAKLGTTVDEQLSEIRRLGQAYADAHRELPVYNEIQRLANDAAIAVGERRFNDAKAALNKLDDLYIADALKFETRMESVEPEFVRNIAEEVPRPLMMAVEAPPPAVPREAIQILEDGRAIIRALTDEPNPEIVIRTLGRLMLRDLNGDELTQVQTWLKTKTKTINTEIKDGRFVDPAAEAKFEDAFAEYIREYTPATGPFVGPVAAAADIPVGAFARLKNAVASVMASADPQTVPVGVRPLFEKMLGGGVPARGQLLPTVKKIIQKNLLGILAKDAPKAIDRIAREAQRLGLKDISGDALTAQFEDVGSATFKRPLFATQDVDQPKEWTLAQVRDDRGNLVNIGNWDGETFTLTKDDVRRLQLMIDDDQLMLAQQQTPQLVVDSIAQGVEEQSMTERLRQITEGSGRLRPVLRIATFLFFGDDAMRDLRMFPPQARQNILAIVRPIQQVIGDSITIASENDPQRIAQFLGGELVAFEKGRPALSSGADYGGLMLRIIESAFDRLDPGMQRQLKLAALLTRSTSKDALNQWGAAFANVNKTGGLNAAYNAAFESADVSTLRAAVDDFMGITTDGGTLLTEDLSRALGLKAAKKDPKRVLTAFEILLYHAGQSERIIDGVVHSYDMTQTSQARMLSLLTELKEAGFADNVINHASVVMAGHGAAERSRTLAARMGLMVDETVYKFYRAMAHGHEVPVKYRAQVEELASRIGMNWLPEYMSNPGPFDGYYVPKVLRERMMDALARVNIRADKTAARLLSEDNMSGASAVFYTYMKTRVTRGAIFLRQKYFTMNTFDHFFQLAQNQGLLPAIVSVVRVAAQDLLVLPGIARTIYLFQKGDLTDAKAIERVRSALQAGGDKAAHVAGNFLGVSKYNIHINPVMEGVDELIKVGNTYYRPSDLRRIAVEEGIFASFDTRALERNIKRQTVELFDTAAVRGASNVRDGLDDIMGMTSDIAEAWSERERLGAMITSIESGMPPRMAARMTVEALYDYAGSMGKRDRLWLVNMVLPFWAFQKNANKHVFDAIFSPWGAYRLGVLRRAQEYGPEYLSHIVYSAMTDPYGVDVSALEPDAEANYWALRNTIENGWGSLESLDNDSRRLLENQVGPLEDLSMEDREFLENGYGGLGNVPTQVKSAMKMLFRDRGIIVDDGEVMSLSSRLLRAKQQFVMGTASSVIPEAQRSGRASYRVNMPAVAIPIRRTEMVKKYYATMLQQNPEHGFVELFLPESTIYAGMRHMSGVAALMILGASGIADTAESGLDLVFGEGDDEMPEPSGRMSYTQAAVNLTEEIFPVERGLMLRYLWPYIGIGDAAPTPVHPALGSMIKTEFGIDLLTVPAVRDPFAAQFAETLGISPEIAEQLSTAKQQREYLLSGPWSMFFENAGLGELNRIMWQMEGMRIGDTALAPATRRLPLEYVSPEAAMAAWARRILGVDVITTMPSETARREEPGRPMFTRLPPSE